MKSLGSAESVWISLPLNSIPFGALPALAQSIIESLSLLAWSTGTGNSSTGPICAADLLSSLASYRLHDIMNMKTVSYQQQKERDAQDPDAPHLSGAYKDMALHANTLEENAQAQEGKRYEPADESVER